MSNNAKDSSNDVEKFWKMPKLGKINLKNMLSHPNFHSDFRQAPINWFLIILGFLGIAFVIATEGFIYRDGNGRIFIKIGMPLLILIFIILILIQGDWQRFEEDHQMLDVAIYIGFILIGFVTLLFYDYIISPNRESYKCR